MKRTINGIVYNTDEPILICRFEKKYEEGQLRPQSALTGMIYGGEIEYTEELYMYPDRSLKLFGQGYGKYASRKRYGGGMGHAMGRSHGYYYETIAGKKSLVLSVENASKWATENMPDINLHEAMEAAAKRFAEIEEIIKKADEDKAKHIKKASKREPIDPFSEKVLKKSWKWENVGNNGIRLVKYLGNDEIVNVPYKVGQDPVVFIGGWLFSPEHNLDYERNEYYKEGIKEIVFPEGIKVIEWHACYGCSALQKVRLPQSLETIKSGAFRNCDSLSEIVIPKNVSNIEALSIGGTHYPHIVLEENSSFKIENGFLMRDKTIIMALSENDSIPSDAKYIGANAFFDNNSIEKITIPSNIETIGECAFLNCSSLTEVILSEGVKEIGDSAFGYCKKLAHISLPKSIASIGKSCFSRCDALEEVIF